MLPETQTHPLVNIFPFLLVGALWAIFITRIAKRKGVNVWLSAILAIIPVMGFFWGFYICSLTDIKVKQDIEELKKQ